MDIDHKPTRSEILEDIADKVTAAKGGLAIGASYEVVMAPVWRALEALHQHADDDDDAKEVESGIVSHRELALIKRQGHEIGGGVGTVRGETIRRLVKTIESTSDDLAKLKAEINKPEVDNFVAGVVMEAAHQRQRWGVEHDAGKTPIDWIFLIGHLLTKAAVLEPGDKRRHRIIAAMAAGANWFLAELGVDTRMRPGIQGPEVNAEEAAEKVKEDAKQLELMTKDNEQLRQVLEHHAFRYINQAHVAQAIDTVVGPGAAQKLRMEIQKVPGKRLI